MSTVYIYDSKTDTFVEEEEFRNRCNSFPEKIENSEYSMVRKFSQDSSAKATELKNRIQVRFILKSVNTVYKVISRSVR